MTKKPVDISESNTSSSSSNMLQERENKRNVSMKITRMLILSVPFLRINIERPNPSLNDARAICSESKIDQYKSPTNHHPAMDQCQFHSCLML